MLSGFSEHSPRRCLCVFSVYKNHHIPPYSSLLPLPGPSLLHHYSTLPYSTPTPLYSILYRYCTRLYTPPLLHSTLLYRYSTLAYLLNRNCTLLYSTPTPLYRYCISLAISGGERHSFVLYTHTTTHLTAVRC